MIFGVQSRVERPRADQGLVDRQRLAISDDDDICLAGDDSRRSKRGRTEIVSNLVCDPVEVDSGDCEAGITQL